MYLKLYIYEFKKITCNSLRCYNIIYLYFVMHFIREIKQRDLLRFPHSENTRNSYRHYNFLNETYVSKKCVKKKSSGIIAYYSNYLIYNLFVF